MTGGTQHSLRGRRVLIVEDEMLVAMELESLLRERGCTVLGPAPTLARALALLEQERPDAALLDLNLNGKQTTPVAAALSARDVPFVVVTGYAAVEADAPELQRAPRLNKPVDHRNLVRVLAAVIDGACPT